MFVSPQIRLIEVRSLWLLGNISKLAPLIILLQDNPTSVSLESILEQVSNNTEEYCKSLYSILKFHCSCSIAPAEEAIAANLLRTTMKDIHISSREEGLLHKNYWRTFFQRCLHYTKPFAMFIKDH